VCGDSESIRIELCDDVQSAVDLEDAGAVGFDEVDRCEELGFQADYEIVQCHFQQKREAGAFERSGGIRRYDQCRNERYASQRCSESEELHLVFDLESLKTQDVDTIVKLWLMEIAGTPLPNRRTIRTYLYVSHTLELERQVDKIPHAAQRRHQVPKGMVKIITYKGSSRCDATLLYMPVSISAIGS
jgi:hypothetical protein